ncbi:FtsX-like permease family protein [Alkalibacter rhizosphaerae]|uniref:FtsX-like permease family protein n=1 Tax=Alkalibacter rhizosphaerae TaxID=2815577 RepID=A0A974XGQ7_9FIRM|nr:ABC transporter permease [Alkalibacter rhizosphaerae]QSX09381.1 FtsX-like permease family protein [Alkalibacter rhizosphaerae]
MVMKNGAFWKNLFRSILRGKGRFLSVMAIIFLGVSFFAGINATKPDMILSADEYFKDQELGDYRIISPLGFKEEDKRSMETIDDVEQVQYGYSKDLFMTMPGGQLSIVKVLSWKDQEGKNGKELNIPYLEEGRMPERSGEILLEKSMYGSVELELGSKVELVLPKEESWEDFFYTKTFTVVGFVRSPLYITFERGQTNIGDGSLDSFAYIMESDFAMEFYNEAYIRVKNADQKQAYSQEYKEVVRRPENALETLGETAMARETGVLRRELEENRDIFLAEKEDAQNQLEEAREELESAQQEIDNGYRKLEEEEARYKQEIESGENQLKASQAQLEYATIQYIDGYTEWLEGYNTYQDGRMDLIEAKFQLDDAEIRIETGQADLDNAKTQLDALAVTIDALKEVRDGLPEDSELPTPEEYEALMIEIEAISPALAQVLRATDPNTITGIRDSLNGAIATLEENYETGMAQWEEGNRQLEEARVEYSAGLKAYEQGVAELQEGREEIDSGKVELDQAKMQIEEGNLKVRQGKEELEEAKAQLETSINEGYLQLEKAQVELDDGWKVFLEEEKDALAQIADAEEKIKDAQRQLLELPKEWFVFTREGNPGYSGYGDDADRIGAVAKIFPLFFFLVAALVCLTTMTRMVDEERTQIGTLKALGYGTGRISSKYLIYSMVASTAGAVLGFSLGFQLFPRLIMTVYGGMYNIPVMRSPYHLNYALLSLAIATLTTTVAAVGASLSTLRSTPATLMQPKAPPPGKRILLERFTLLWDRMSFIQKVTARNIFRYKRRFLMTVIGIAGCSALLLTGFGIRDSVNAISDVQFDEVFLYDGVVVADPDNEKFEGFDPLLQDNPDVEEYGAIHLESVSVYSEKGGREFEASLYIPEDLGLFPRFFDLHQRIGKEPYVLGTDGAVITEKLAKLLDIEEGDVLEYRDTDNRVYQFTVAGLAENYLGHNIFMSPEYFDQVTLRSPVYNGGIFNRAEGVAFQEGPFKEKLLSREGVLAVSLTDTFRKEFYDTMGSLDYVVLVLILSAGALAFVVLYNLTNINITERIREIATIKVLGFRSKEVSAYVYRENLVLSFIGTVAGLGLGFVLHKFVMDTMEVDNMMFGKIIHWSSYLFSIALTLIFAVLVNVLMFYKLRNIDMVESLKSVE